MRRVRPPNALHKHVVKAFRFSESHSINDASRLPMRPLVPMPTREERRAAELLRKATLTPPKQKK